jgi:inner membrane transporter RhtA
LVAAIEFVGTIAVALAGLRSRRNLVALVLSVAGVGILIDVAWSDAPVGLAWALANGGLFVVYIVLGHRAALGGAGQGIARLGAAMAVAFVFVLPVGITEAVQAFGMPALLAAGIGVGVCSSVIPYICDQLAMAKLPRASYAAMLALLPATATIVGAVVLSQIPTVLDLVGIALVITGIATHRPAPATTW